MANNMKEIGESYNVAFLEYDMSLLKRAIKFWAVFTLIVKNRVLCCNIPLFLNTFF